MPNRYTNINETHLDAIFANDKYRMVYFDVSAPNGRHKHPRFLMRCTVERLLTEGYTLRLQ